MSDSGHTSTRAALIWAGLIALTLGPVLSIAASPQLAYRQPIYITSSFAGGVAMALLILQPLLPNGRLPTLTARRGRAIHRLTGTVLVGAVALHVIALAFTSPPDVLDALLFASPTPFSIWGVLAMWGVVLTAALAVMRRKLAPRSWRRVHVGLGAFIAIGTVLHVALIDGTLGLAAKIMLSVMLGLTTGAAVWRVGRR